MAGMFSTREGPEGSGVGMGSLTVIASNKAMQVTDDRWDAVVTSNDKGIFLIRRQKGHLSSQCPFLCYEVRCITTGDHGSQKSGGQSGDEGFARHPAAAAVSACAFHTPPRGCDRDERETP